MSFLDIVAALAIFLIISIALECTHDIDIASPSVHLSVIYVTCQICQCRYCVRCVSHYYVNFEIKFVIILSQIDTLHTIWVFAFDGYFV